LNKINKVMLPKELSVAFKQKSISASSVAAAKPYYAKSFEHLMRIVAGVSAYNPRYTVLFRGQSQDYPADKLASSVILPGIYRNLPLDDVAAVADLDQRFKKLHDASDLLARALSGRETKKFVARRIQQWALIQHYEICATPLLDLTRSLRVACWFALDGAEDSDSPVLYVFGMPYMHDRIALDSNCELFQMNLMSLLPPNAERPSFQEGVLAGYEQPDNKLKAVKESDFSRRLLAKIALPRTREFRDSIGLDRDLVYPPGDPYLPVREDVREQLAENDVHAERSTLVEGLLKSGKAMADAYADAVRLL